MENPAFRSFGSVSASSAPRRILRPVSPRVFQTGEHRDILPSDRIFVRLSPMRYGFGQSMEFSLSNAADMTDVFGALRSRTRGLSGLYRLYIRNISRGWSTDRPFKLSPKNLHPSPFTLLP